MLAATTFLNVIAILAFNVLPTVVEGAQKSLHLSASAVGVLSSFIMAGNMLGSILAKYWVRRVPWPRSARVILGGQILTNGLCTLIHAPDAFFGLQLCAGFFSGSLYSLTLIILSDRERPDRDFGIVVAAQALSQVLGLILGPSLIVSGGIDAVLAVFAVCGTLGMIATRWLPAAGPRPTAQLSYAALMAPGTTLALLGCGSFFVSTGAYWTYVALIGEGAGFSADQVAQSLVLGVTAGFIGAVTAAGCGTKLPRTALLGVGALMAIIAVAILAGRMSLVEFLLSCCLFNFAWNFSLTYQYAAVNAVDASGHAVSLAPAFHAAGASAGPAIAAVFVGAQHFASVLWLVVAGVLVSVACFAAGWATHNRHSSHTSLTSRT